MQAANRDSNPDYFDQYLQLLPLLRFYAMLRCINLNTPIIPAKINMQWISLKGKKANIFPNFVVVVVARSTESTAHTNTHTYTQVHSHILYMHTAQSGGREAARWLT